MLRSNHRDIPASPDLTSIELRQTFRSRSPSPAPTYRTTNARSPTWPSTTASNTPYHWQDEKKAPTAAATAPNPKETAKSHRFFPSPSPTAFSTPPDPRDPSHPHYTPPNPPLTLPLPIPPRHPHRRRRKFIIKTLPWILSVAFLLSTLYLLSLLLSTKLLHLLHPAPAMPSINVVINGSGPSPSAVITTITPTPTPEDNLGKQLGAVSSSLVPSASVSVTSSASVQSTSGPRFVLGATGTGGRGVPAPVATTMVTSTR